jgi:fructose-1,6-bisphosphatase II
MKSKEGPVLSAPGFIPDHSNETNIERDLSFHLVRVVEEAAVACARTMGQGNAEESDHAAVQAMRQAFETVPIAGNIVIGEGERDKAPMLYIGERVGSPERPGVEFPGLDIAVDPLEGTNLCSTGAPNAIAVLAASEPGGLLHAPDCYMEKIVAGPACRGALDLDAPVSQNLKSIARRLDRDVTDLTIIVLDRPRHRQLIADIRRSGARIHLIGDGDLSAAIAVAVRGNGVHAVMGIGGAPEGVLAAAAMRCLHGEMVGRLVINTPELAERVAKMGIKNPERIYTAGDLAIGSHIIFAACGVTDGALLRGVRFFGEGYRTHTLVMTSGTNCVRFVDAVHMHSKPGPRGVRLY